MSDRDDIILKFGRNRLLAHMALFKHRHSDTTPDFHHDIISLWHSLAEKVLVMAFREGAKSTIAEEAICLQACMGLFHNAIIIGENLDRACDRLRAIKHELETNTFLTELYGYQVGQTWNEAKVILNNGVCIQAFGRGQSFRGVKHLQYRPDYLFCDDIEGEEHIKEIAARDETMRWLLAVVLPALDKKARVRINATPLDRDALPMRLWKDPSWIKRKYPIEYRDASGERKATWPGRYPLDWIDAKRQEFATHGMLQDYLREYMCEADDPSLKMFTAGMFKVEPKVRSWHPTFAFYDPARTTTNLSATTGWAVWSWIANRMIVWDAGGEFWKPDQIINHIFELDQKYRPVMIGVEKDGLEEFIMQPLRQEALRRGVLIPIVPYKAPVGKLSFIGALQPFLIANEITLNQALPDLVAQFLSFPTGRIDIPNALAYSLLMRPGQVLYEDFGSGNVVESLPVRQREPVYLCLNATPIITTGVAVQFISGGLHVLGDYVREGDPGATLKDIVQSAALDFGPPKLVAGRVHFDTFDTIGLKGAIAKLPAAVTWGGEPIVGQQEIRKLLRLTIRGHAALRVNSTAKWTLNGFAVGYAREIDRKGRMQEEARQGVYRTLFEGLEAFTARLSLGIETEVGGALNVKTTPSGQRYISALPGERGADDAKGAWINPRSTG